MLLGTNTIGNTVLIVIAARAVLLATQPTELVPVTEYVLFTVGFTVKVPPLIVYVPLVPAPDPTITAVLPEQITELLALMVGVALTVTFDTAVAVQPFAAVPVTV
jgi:hypothetical protein